MKNKDFVESIKCALNGLHSGFVSERNFKIYTGIGIVFLFFNVILRANQYDYVLFVLLAAFVFAMEYMNTAVERAIDKLGEEINDEFRFAKDVAAAAVLVSGIAFFLGEGIILIFRLVK